MSEDNAYVRGSVSRQEPHKEELRNEADDAVTHIKVLQDVFDRLKDRIAYYGSVDSIPGEILASPDEFMHTYAANKLVRENLRQELDYLVSTLPEGLLKE